MKFRHIFQNGILLCCASLLFFAACKPEKPEFVIGVSQCSNDEWRTQMNREIQREALFFPDLQVIIKSAHDNNAQQIRDIQDFLDQKVDLLIVSPNEAHAIAPIIKKADQCGVPVVLVDRKINTSDYKAYLGADNYEIGRHIGAYVQERLNGKGQVIELTGLQGSTPAAERHRGLMDELRANKNMKMLATVSAGWQEDDAQRVFDSVLTHHPKVDMVVAQNDRMALGAYRAAKKRNRNKDILFVGVDALSGEGMGVDLVLKGVLDASFIYPTAGDSLVQLAMHILRGEPYKKENILSTALVNRQNARVMQMQTQHIETLDRKIEYLSTQLDRFLMRYSSQRVLLLACLLIILLAAVLLVFLVHAFWTKKRLNEELSRQKETLEVQRDQLLALSKQLEEATHAKLSFFTNVSHDIRTPLTLISAPIEQLQRSTHLDEQERFLLNMAHKNVTVLLRLVNQILDFRKYENGKLELHLSRFNLQKALLEWTDSFKALSYRKQIHFQCHIEPAEYPEVIADAEKMERILYNLLSNAFKFTPINGSVTVSQSFFMKDGIRWIRLSVKDDGVGISPEHARHVFDSFYQVDVHYSGSGIGLALVKAFVEMHHGEVRVDTDEGKGAMFTVEMPAEQAGNIQSGNNSLPKNNEFKEGAIHIAEQHNLSAQYTEVSGKEYSVLLIDDDQEIRNYVCSFLRNEYNILEAANGQEGLRMAIKYVPDAIVCDVMMPVMDGMEFCRRLKQEVLTSHIPVMMLTAYAVDDQKIKGYECGADSYISKPFSAELLKARLKNLIENRKRLKDFFTEEALPVSAKPSVSDLDQGFVEKLRTLITRNLHNPDFSVEDLGDKVGLSRVQLYRKTKALCGYSPNELLRIARMKKAASLLASTEKTISEVSFEVGFNSPSYFAKCFREYFGENPTDFLKRKNQSES